MNTFPQFNTSESRPEGVKFLNVVLLLLSAVYAVIPDLRKFIPVSVLLGCSVIWYFEAFGLERHSSKFAYKSILVAVVLWMAYDFLLLLLGISTASIGNYYLRISYFDIIVKAFYLKQYYTEKQKDFVFRCLQFTVMWYAIANIQLASVDENIHEMIYIDSDLDKDQFVAGTQFYNLLAFFIGLNAIHVFTENSSFWKYISLLSIVISYWFMLTVDSRATSLTISIVLIAIAFIVKARVNGKPLGLIFLVFAGLCIIVLFYWNEIVAMLPHRVAIRYLAVSGMKGGDTDTLGRTTLILHSLKTFVTYPLWGIGYHLDSSYLKVVGQHSLITDYMAWYGMVGVLFLVYYFRYLFLRIPFGFKNETIRKFVQSLVVIYIIASILQNTFNASIAISAFLMTACLCDKQKQILK
jgi:hypothetical protein